MFMVTASSLVPAEFIWQEQEVEKSLGSGSIYQIFRSRVLNKSYSLNYAIFWLFVLVWMGKPAIK
jgi:hypothetical protein